MTTDNLWGDLSKLTTPRTPKNILTDQANALNEMTNGVIRAEVRTLQNSGQLSHSLRIIAPALDNYRVGIATARHYAQMYPCTLIDDTSGFEFNCGSQSEFIATLRQILSSDTTKAIISSLIAQSQ